ncbi:unnamed protein product [Arctogadus glacialis]
MLSRPLNPVVSEERRGNPFICVTHVADTVIMGPHISLPTEGNRENREQVEWRHAGPCCQSGLSLGVLLSLSSVKP